MNEEALKPHNTIAQIEARDPILTNLRAGVAALREGMLTVSKDVKQIAPGLPDMPCADLIGILGRPCFACANTAAQLRRGGWIIKNRAEDEQAAVLLFTLKHWLADKANWRKNCDCELQEMANAARKELEKASD